MSETEFKPGDIVQLKSGGPQMTITDIDNYYGTLGSTKKSANCSWFDGKQLTSQILELVSLKKA